MALYFAPAFFAHLLGKCLARRGVMAKVGAVAKLGLVVVATFAAVWAPFLEDPAVALKVLQRLVPIRRGLFEDYVANAWCVTHVAIKWKALFSQAQLVHMCTGATLMAFLPSMIQQVARPSPQGLLLCLANSAFAFFLFSYQVHEKSILLPLLPVTMMAGREPYLAAVLPLVASFSMFPLLQKDSLAIAYTGTNLFWTCVAAPQLLPPQRPLLCCLSVAAIATMLVVHLVAATRPPPERYPFLYDLLMVSCSFACFAVSALYLNFKQLLLPPHPGRERIGQGVKED
mmetsp:Transcript_32802/g.93082  ORF Transcript_32802/g.93082 Transcript_32802/m.93082 type:complete len:286 (-) Transcript_32802:510-1367(-)